MDCKEEGQERGGEREGERRRDGRRESWSWRGREGRKKEYIESEKWRER